MKKYREKFDETNLVHQRFKSLVVRYTPEVLSAVKKTAGNRMNDPDIVVSKTVWTTLWGYLPHLPLLNRLEFLKLFKWATMKRLYDYFRSQKRKTDHEISLTEFPEEIVPLQGSPYEEVERMVRRMAVHEALGKLSSTDSRIAWMVLAEQRSQKETANILDIDRRYISRRLPFIIHKLRALLKHVVD